MNDRIVPLNGIETKQIEWLWEDRIPLGEITLLDGDPGDGKSTLMYDIAARVTTEAPMPFAKDAVVPAGVILLQEEDSVAATIRPSIEAAGGDINRVHVYERNASFENPLSLPRDIRTIEDAVCSIDAKLIVIDPLLSFIEGAANSPASIKKAMSVLARVAQKRNVAIVVVRHLTKAKTSNSKYQGTGSIGIIGAARSALLVGPDPESDCIHQHILSLNKSNLSDAAALIYRTVKSEAAISVEWMGESKPKLNLTTDSAVQLAYSQLDEACYVLFTILSGSDEPLPAKLVQTNASQALVTPRTLKRAKKKLGVKSRSVTVLVDGEAARQWVWELPKTNETLMPYEERALRETILECADVVDEDDACEIDASYTPMSRPWSELPKQDANPDTIKVVDDSSDGRPWDA